MTESRTVGALSKLDEFLLIPQIRTFRKNYVKNQEQSGERSQNGHHPDLEFSACCVSNPSDSDP